MSDREKQEEAIFEQAMQMASDAERAAYLNKACGGDPELRARLEVLLEGHFKGQGFLDHVPGRAARSAGTVRVSTPDEEEVGTVIGHYKLLEKIGEGGFGAVYVAEQREPVKRRVALKIIKLGMDTKQVIARFEAERQALALMEHDNIAKVFDAGATETGRPYFVMELVRGIRITDYCDEHSLTTVERLDLFMQVCHAIQHAHQKGIIHRDIKPSNILVTVVDGQPVPKVIDFGIAKAIQGQLSEKTVYTQLHQFIGTPAYMSPEQAQLSGVDVDTRSDIYSLGVLLYELLTAHTPFDPKTLLAAGLDEMRRMIREQEPPRPSARISTLNEAERTTLAKHRQAEPGALSRLVRGDLDWIVMKCLEKERGRRYETANSVALDVERHLRHEPVTAAAPSARYRFQKFVQRNKTALGVAGVLGLLLIAGSVVSTWEAIRATRAEAKEKTQRLRAEAEKERADIKTREAETHAKAASQEKDTARFNLYASQMSLIQQELAGQQVGPALNLLEGLRPKKGEEDLRGFEWYYLWRQCNRGLLATLRGHEKRVQALAFSPDGTSLVSASSDGTVMSWTLEGGMEHKTLGRVQTGNAANSARSGWIICCQFSPDGKVLAVGRTNGTIAVWDVTRRIERMNLKAHSGAVRSLAFSPDSRRLASGGRDQMVRVWDINTGESVEPAWYVDAFMNAPPVTIAFSPDGKLLAANSYGVIEIYDFASHQVRQTLAGQQSWIRWVAFLPDGKTLVSGGNNRTMKFWDVATGREKTELERVGTFGELAVSPDGTCLSLGHDDGTIEFWDLGSRQTRLCGHTDGVCALAFSPDGNLLASGSRDRTIKLWDRRRPQDLPPGKPLWFRVWSLDFSPDGKLLASGPDPATGPASVLEVATGQVLATPPSSIAVAFSPDGKTLASVWGNDVKLRDVATWLEKATLAGGHTQFVTAVRFSPDGKILASGASDGAICLWDALSYKRRTRIEGAHPSKWVNSFAFSPDGARLASAGGQRCSGGEAALWDVATGQKRATLPLGTTCVTFALDGKTLASGLHGGNIGLWDAATGALKAEMSGPPQLGDVIAFLPDGRTLVSQNGEGSISFWDTVRGRARATLRRSQDKLQTLALSPDGRTLAVGRSDGAVEFWRAADEREVTGQRQGFEPLVELAGESSGHGFRLQQRQQDVAAQEAYLNAVALYESAAAQFPGWTEYKPRLAQAYRQLVKLVAGSSQLATQDCSRALVFADKAIELTRNDPTAAPEQAALWHAKGELLEKVGQPEEALKAMTRAVELACASTNSRALKPAEARLSRSSLLLRMNRLAEAATDHCQAFGIPLRDSLAPTNLIDLSLFYNAALHENWQGITGNSLATLPTGVQKLAQAQFDVRGLIQLNAEDLQARVGDRYPASAAGIPIHRKFARLHVLHGTGWWMDARSKIGAYILHYADGQQVGLPILYGEDVLDWWRWQPTDGKEAARATLAWTGSNPAVTEQGGSLRLFKRTWDNPRPDAEVESLDFTSAGTKCAPFLIALTVE